MRLIDGDYLYNKLVANKCPYDLVLQMVKDEPTVDVLEQIRDAIEREADYQDANVNADVAKGMYMALEMIDKHREERGI